MGNFVQCWCGWQTVGSASDENRFTVCEQARRVYYAAVFKAKKEILVKNISWLLEIIVYGVFRTSH
jgi:hypothetical protein